MLSALFRGLIDYNPETSEPQFTGVAASIESPDEGLTWEIALNEGWTFHDGTPVTAQSFVDSWNYSALRAQCGPGVGFLRVDRGIRRPPVRDRDGARPGDR